MMAVRAPPSGRSLPGAARGAFTRTALRWIPSFRLPGGSRGIRPRGGGVGQDLAHRRAPALAAGALLLSLQACGAFMQPPALLPSHGAGRRGAALPLAAMSGDAGGKTLVIGGTGKVGKLVVERLSAAGRPVVALARDPQGDAARALAALPGVEVAPGDCTDLPSLNAAMAGCAGVIATYGCRRAHAPCPSSPPLPPPCNAPRATPRGAPRARPRARSASARQPLTPR